MTFLSSGINISPIFPIIFLVSFTLGIKIISNQNGCGPNVAKANAVWIGSGDTPTISMTAFNRESIFFILCWMFIISIGDLCRCFVGRRPAFFDSWKLLAVETTTGFGANARVLFVINITKKANRNLGRSRLEYFIIFQSNVKWDVCCLFSNWIL